MAHHKLISDEAYLTEGTPSDDAIPGECPLRAIRPVTAAVRAESWNFQVTGKHRQGAVATSGESGLCRETPGAT